MAACLAAGCAADSEGIVVDVALTHHPGGGDRRVGVRYADGEPRGTVTDVGFGVVVEDARVTLASLELLSCDAGTGAGMAARLWRWLDPVPNARAHGTGPVLIGTPHLVDLMRADSTLFEASRFLPPPDSYCRLRVRFEPADAHTVGLAQAPGAEGWTALVRGHAGLPDGPEIVPFRVRGTHTLTVDLDLVDDEGQAVVLGLTPRDAKASVVVSLGYGMACAALDASGSEEGEGACRGMLDGIDLSPSGLHGLGEEWAAREVLRNLAHNMRAVVCRDDVCRSSLGVAADREITR